LTVRYTEPARSYWSALALAAVIGAGWLLDGLIGGAGAHALAWALALVLVVGIDALAIAAARSARSLTVSDDEVRVGEDAVARADLTALAADAPPEARVLGRRPGEDAPRGTSPVPVVLADGSTLVVPSRRPERLTAALGLGADRPAVRPAEPADEPLLAEIEERAGTLFRVAGYPPIPDHPRPHEALFVLVAGRPAVGFARVVELDGRAHLDELDVLPGRMRQGIGTELIEAACTEARRRGYGEMTLTAFRDVAWNAPLYRRRGFADCPDPGPELAAERRAEQDAGLDAIGPRIAMIRRLEDWVE
jgi:GNAT superfamily N-acetyltransferase